MDGGEGGIRTHGPREGTPVFKTGAFNRSATSPAGLERGRKLLQSLLPVQPDGKRANNQGNRRAMRRIPDFHTVTDNRPEGLCRGAKPSGLFAVAPHARAKIRRVKLLI